MIESLVQEIIQSVAGIDLAMGKSLLERQWVKETWRETSQTGRIRSGVMLIVKTRDADEIADVIESWRYIVGFEHGESIRDKFGWDAWTPAGTSTFTCDIDAGTRRGLFYYAGVIYPSFYFTPQYVNAATPVEYTYVKTTLGTAAYITIEWHKPDPDNAVVAHQIYDTSVKAINNIGYVNVATGLDPAKPWVIRFTPVPGTATTLHEVLVEGVVAGSVTTTNYQNRSWVTNPLYRTRIYTSGGPATWGRWLFYDVNVPWSNLPDYMLTETDTFLALTSPVVSEVGPINSVPHSKIEFEVSWKP